MTTIDALAFPHILDAILHGLHQDAQHRTLANFRQTCSAVKEVIDSCLPRRLILAGYPTNLSGKLQVNLSVAAETRFWGALTEVWHRPPIDHVVDVHFNLESHQPYHNCQGGERLPVLRLFDHRGALPPLSADTVVIFLSATHYSKTEQQTYVRLPSNSNRTIISMHSDSRLGAVQPPDFRFAYDLESSSSISRRPLQAVLHRKQELVLMITCGSGAQAGHLRQWTASVVDALYANPLLTVILLVDGWSWRWFTAEGEVEKWSWLQDVADERGRLEQAWHYYFMGSIVEADEDEGWPAELFHGRVKLMTMSEFDAQAGMRMSALVEAG
ncbi:hypothetical protein A1Q2_00102 [Trichosporon asahii var. asahii CBS 8904]|uniref:Uncharacterized protein n=1 Tax=Trichosporon asahii var. asahii (strain CBS 8904) TaxID=1220162 RepID=K1W1E6_TRIAC|nr:hypothetical protein A1Q2_00102 [Trichosporon asahii var. asahii CBS 8904]